MNKKYIWVIISLLFVVLLVLKLFVFNETDAIKFKKEYSGVSKDNKFVYKNIDEVIKTLEEGTGVIYFGFPECPWCQKYVKFIDEISKDSDIKEVIYFNISKDRKDNTKEYQKIVSILKENLNKDNNDNERIFVPHIVSVKEGKILDNNNETATITEQIDPNEYWTKEKQDEIKITLKKMFDKVTSNICTTNCN